MLWITHIKQNMSSRICLIGPCWKTQSPLLPQTNMGCKSMSPCAETLHQENWPRKVRHLWIYKTSTRGNFVCCQSFWVLLEFMTGAMLSYKPNDSGQVIHNVRKNNLRAPSAWGHSNKQKCNGNFKFCLKFYSTSNALQTTPEIWHLPQTTNQTMIK